MSQETLPEFGISKSIKQVGRTDLPGGGLVTVENGYAYVGHIDPRYGTSIVDVHDRKHPKLVSQLEVPEGISYSPKEVGYYVPAPGKGQKTVKSNDVFRSDNGLLYLLDRYNGLEILENQV